MALPMTRAVKHALNSGKRFNPSDEQAINFYLRRRVVGEPLPNTVVGVIHEEEVYELEPKELAKKYTRLPRTHNRFFFTTCKRQKAGKGYRMSRATGGPGSWVGTGNKDVKNSADQKIGSHETLKYVYKDKSRKSDWRMDEYRCCGMDELAVDVDGRERVFCRLYIPQNSKNSVTLHESLEGDPKPKVTAAEQQQKPQQESATAMAVQQELPRRQEQVVHVLPAITQPQEIKRPPPPPRALDQQAPMRQAQQGVEQPCPKRMRPTLAPLKAPLPSGHGMVPWMTQKQQSLCSSPAMPQQQASPSPWATPRRISPRSRRVALAPSPWPAAEAPTNVMNGNGESMSLLMGAPEEDHAMIQEEAGNHDDDDFNSWVEGLGTELEEVPAAEEHGGNIQEGGQHNQHATSLEGFVTDDRGDDVMAQDAWDFTNVPIHGTGDIDYNVPISD